MRRLNDNDRKIATIEDVTAVEEGVIEWAESYFRDMYKNAPAAAREAIDQLAQGRAVTMAPLTRRWLNQRYLLDESEQLTIPVFGAWVRFHALV
ncbi:MAG: hypothetical protein ACKV2U_08305 [Bryobacteraceae bacterium]